MGLVSSRTAWGLILAMGLALICGVSVVQCFWCFGFILGYGFMVFWWRGFSWLWVCGFGDGGGGGGGVALGLGYGGGRVGLGCFGGGSGWSVVAGVADVGVLMLVNLEC